MKGVWLAIVLLLSIGVTDGNAKTNTVNDRVNGNSWNWSRPGGGWDSPVLQRTPKRPAHFVHAFKRKPHPRVVAEGSSNSLPIKDADERIVHPDFPWCGWFMRKLVVEKGMIDHDPGSEYNRAIEWAHIGSPAPGPGPDVIGVLPHHVFMVLKVLSSHVVLGISGNDSHRVRTRPRSTEGVIAWRKI